jgi:hypothetical protein
MRTTNVYIDGFNLFYRAGASPAVMTPTTE